MIAARLLPIAAAAALSLHAGLTSALPINNEELSLRSFGSVANDDAATLALREPSEEDELLDLIQRAPQIAAPGLGGFAVPLRRPPPAFMNPQMRPQPAFINMPQPGLVNPRFMLHPMRYI
ncbi:hypothetical protein EST38_g13808 [Candolleomyces aberdarensis]|uniref:Uncharacterized protein n=1 Tax=Candolleomyces aberdarensis TaxID=2316362 RepID=A0A4Q2D0V3_9AGAR|nr:hypothetical protein EST38_g13808 [Candolleomyces aberdarensis]